jgi:hypothetical protein
MRCREIARTQGLRGLLWFGMRSVPNWLKTTVRERMAGSLSTIKGGRCERLEQRRTSGGRAPKLSRQNHPQILLTNQEQVNKNSRCAKGFGGASPPIIEAWQEAIRDLRKLGDPSNLSQGA